MFPDNRLNKIHGIGLPGALFIVVVLAVIVAAMSQIILSNSQSVSVQIQSQRAFYSAESGMQIAMNLLFPPDGSAGQNCATSPFYSRTFSTAGLGQCSVSVSCRSMLNGTDTYYVLNSNGVCGSGSDRAERKVEVMTQ